MEAIGRLNSKWVLLLACLALVPASVHAAGYGEAGPHAVETMLVDWQSGQGGRTVPAKIYHPARATNACPVIVFSHGLGGTREGYEYLGRHWASHGYVSVHLQHAGSDDSVWRGAARPMEAMRAATRNMTNAANRPVDVRFALDQLERMNKEGVLKADTGRAGIAGHSFGAWTTLVIAGQTLGPAGRSLADPRFKAAIAMSAPVPRPVGDQTYERIRIPIFHLTGTADDSPVNDTKAAERRIPFDRISNAPQYLLTFEGGDHMVFSGARRRGGEAAQQRPANARIHELIKAGTTAFWDANLKQDRAAHEWLDGGAFTEAVGKAGKLERKQP